MRMMKRDVAKRYGGRGIQHPPFIIISYLNTLHIRQKTTSESNINLNATIRIQQGELALTSTFTLLLFVFMWCKDGESTLSVRELYGNRV